VCDEDEIVHARFGLGACEAVDDRLNDVRQGALGDQLALSELGMYYDVRHTSERAAVCCTDGVLAGKVGEALVDDLIDIVGNDIMAFPTYDGRSVVW
jgi:hypothetical protein